MWNVIAWIGFNRITDSNKIEVIVEALIFSGFLFPIALIGKFTAMIILHFDLQSQFKYMNYFIYTSHQDQGYCFRRAKVKRIEKNSNDRSGCLFGRLYDIVNTHANADMAK